MLKNIKMEKQVREKSFLLLLLKTELAWLKWIITISLYYGRYQELVKTSISTHKICNLELSQSYDLLKSTIFGQNLPKIYSFGSKCQKYSLQIYIFCEIKL